MTWLDWLMASIVGLWASAFVVLAWPQAKQPRANVRKERP